MELEFNLQSFLKSTKKCISICIVMMLVITSFLSIGASANDFLVTPSNMVLSEDALEYSIRAGETKTIEIVANNVTYIAFTPEATGVYNFYSSSSSDTYGYLFDENKNQLTYNDDSIGYDFSISYTLERGVQYYWGARYYDPESSSSFNVTLECIEFLCDHINTTSDIGKVATCTEDGYTEGVYCNDCDMWIEGHEIIRAEAHNDENDDQVCDVCGSDIRIFRKGTCGDNLEWSLYETGVFEITGEGDMTNWSSSSNVPWHSYRSNIQTVNIGDFVTSIGTYAFSGCENLLSIEISDSITNIGNYAFDGCYNLTDVCYKGAEVIWNKINIGAYNECLTYVYFNYNSGACGDNLIWILDPETGVLDITGEGDMYNYYNDYDVPWNYSDVKSVNIGNGVTSIGDYAFRWCKNLTSITISDSVTSIGDSAFYYCESLTNITIPDSVTSIGDSAFDFCLNLTNVTIGNGVTSIGDDAFTSCSNLTSITIPDSVTSIGDWAFSGCDSLTDVYITDIAAWCNIKFASFLSNPLSCAENLYLNNELVKNLVIPDTVTSISDYAFSEYACLTSITIPDSVTNIGLEAFASCSSLESVTVGKGVTSIGISAFSYCQSLTSFTVDEDNQYYSSDEDGVLFNKDKTVLVRYPMGKTRTTYKIPDTVTDIGEWAFNCCETITNVIISNSVINIREGAFSGCRNLTSVTIPDSVTSIGDEAFVFCTSLTSIAIPDSVTSIGIYAFGYCESLTSIIIPDSVTNIEGGVFDGCSNLKNVTIGKGVVSIKSWSFSYCQSLTSFTVDEDNQYYSSDEDGVLFNKDKTVLVRYPMGKTRTSYTIPDSVIGIGDGAFYYCENLTNVTIPNSITSIGDDAFISCSNLTSITIPNSVTTIGNHAFDCCVRLTSIKIGNGVTNIGDYAFSGCKSLTSITIPDSVTSIGNNAFSYCEKLRSATIGNSVTNIEEYAFYWCESLTSVTIGNSVTNIGEHVFASCSNLTSITIPDSVTSIGDRAFSFCDSLENVVIGNGVKSISYEAFIWCENLKSVTIGNSVTSIGEAAFAYCDSLTNITIPDSVKSIGSQAFAYCDNLTNVIIGNKVTNIGGGAFDSCYNISDVYYKGSEVTWNKINIGDYNDCLTSNVRFRVISGTCGSNLVWTLDPDTGVLNIMGEGRMTNWIASFAIPWYSYRSYIRTVNIDNEVTSIGNYAFYDCYNLKSVIIGSGVTSIGNYAFRYCYDITTAYYNGSNADWNRVSVGSYNSNLTSKIRSRYFSGTCGINLRWEIDFLTGTLEITGTGNMTNWSYSSVPWRSYRAYIKTINIGNGVRSIGNYAFYDCYNLTNITIGNSVTSIGNDAFYDCDNLTSVTIGNSVTKIGDYAFYDCDDLTSVEFVFLNVTDGNVTNSDVTSGNVTNGDIIDDYVTGGNVTNGDIISEYVTDGNVTNGNVTNGDITSGNPVRSIGKNAFASCRKLENVYITDVAAWCNVRFANASANPLYCAKNLYLDNKLVQDLVISDPVTSISNYAFYNCDSLTSVTIEGSVKKIGHYAFYDCDGLKSVSIEFAFSDDEDEQLNSGDNTANVTNGDIISEYVTDGNVTNGNVTNGNVTSGNVTDGNIGSYAFAGCNNLTSVIIGNFVENIGSHAFLNCPVLRNVNLGTWLKSIGGNAFVYCGALMSITIPESLKTIGNAAFECCYALKNITIPDTVEKIGTNAFYATAYYYNTRNWEDGALYIGNHLVDASDVSGDYVIKDGTKTIASTAFSHCRGLISVTIPNSIKQIGYGVFSNCSALTEVIIPDSVTEICEDAFCFCTGLMSIKLPHSLSKIEISAFGNCCNLTDVYYDGDEDDWAKIEIETDTKTWYFIDIYTDGLIISNDPLTSATIHYSSHYYLETVTKEPTCTETGIKIYMCQCGDTYTETIDALGHDYQIDGTIAPSCTTGGYGIYQCTHCEKYEVRKIPVSEHTFELIVTKAPTCTTDGSGFKKCSVCGYECEEEIILALGHNYLSVGIVDATCTDEGYEIFKCENCQDYQLNIIPTNDLHDYDENSVCSKCGAKEENNLPIVSVSEGMSTIIDSEKKVISCLAENLNTESIMEYIAVSDDVTVSFSNDVIGTGTVITIEDKSGNVLDSYTAVIFGDYNGDGVADVEDTAYFASIANFEIFDYYDYEYLFMAADINGDGVVDSMDEEDMYAVANYEAYIDHTITDGSKVIRY